jgi:hypothetical protein
MLAAIMVIGLAVAAPARAQALQQVPSSALVVVKVSDLEATSKKLADFFTTLGLVQMNPNLADPLGYFETQSGVTQGLNKSGDMALAYLDPAVVGAAAPNNNQTMLALFPVSDYNAFISNFPGATTDGGVTTAQFKNNPEPAYVAHWGNYAAVSPIKSIVATPPTAIVQISGLASKEMDAKDMVVWANVKALRAKSIPLLEQGRVQMAAQVDQMAQNHQTIGTIDAAKVAPVLKVAGNQAISLVEEFINDCNDATLSTNLSPDGIGTTFAMEFEPTTKLGQMVTQAKSTDESLLSGIPEGKYLFYGGAVASPEQTITFINGFVDPVEKAITGLGPDYASFNDVIEATKAMIAAQTGARIAVLAPAGMLGQEPLAQAIVIRQGDSATLLAAQRKAITAWQTALKTVGATNTGSTTTITQGAKTLDGITFDLVQTTFDMSAAGPQGAQIMQFMTFLYGPNGLQQYIGPVGDSSLLAVTGMSDPAISGAIAAIKSGDDPLAKLATTKAVAAQLPTQRSSAFYIPLDMWAETGLNYAKQFSMDMGVTIPEDLPPIGATVSTDGPALRVDAYTPSKLLEALTSAGIQGYMAAHQGQGQGGPPPGQSPDQNPQGGEQPMPPGGEQPAPQQPPPAPGQ